MGFGGFYRGTKLFFVPVEKRDSVTLITIIKDYVTNKIYLVPYGTSSNYTKVKTTLSDT